MGTMFNGLLFFPITPYRADGEVDLDELAAHIGRGVDAGAGGVFAACGTGEFSALEPGEYAEVVSATAACCRYVDLAIFGQHDPEHARAPADLVEQVLLGSGRPVLVVPSAGEHLEVGRRVLVVWNSTPEASRALHDALPLLEGAEAVAVIALQRPGDAEALARMPPLDVVAHLGAHGIAAGYERLVAHDEDRLLDVLLNRTFDFHADLLVIGAQGLEDVPLLQRPTAARQLLGSMLTPVLLSR